MTEIKRYDVNKANMIGLVRFDEKESGRWVKYEDLAAIQEQLSQFSMSAGHADQRKAESVAVRVALGFSADADDVAPCDLVDAIASLQEQVRALAAESVLIKSSVPNLKDIEFDNENMDDVSIGEDIGFNETVELMKKCLGQTPATDAIIREIRAQAIEALRDSISDIDNGIENTIDLHHYCTDFAARIRAGEQP
jgi:hypothetical protein